MVGKRRAWPALIVVVILGLSALVLFSAKPAARADPSDPNWSTYHHDGQRTGVDPTQGNAASVAAGWTSGALDGAVYAEPLVLNGHVLVATEANTVYWLNAADGGVVWGTNLGAPVDSSSFPCGNINPIGITGTPAVDAAAGIVYAVAFLAPSHHELFALNLADGSTLWHRPVDAAGSDPTLQNQRGALALMQGRVYVPFGGRDGDCGQYVGRIVASAADGSGALLSYSVPTSREGGIWSPAGLTVDPAGTLLAATGNSASTSAFDYGESVIRFSPTLSVLDSWAPTNWAALNASDTDIGSVGPTLLAGSRIFQIGKEGVGYLLAADHLGGIGGELFSAQVCGSGAGVWGGTAYQAPFVYIPCSDGLVAVRVAADGSSFSVAWRGPAGYSESPIVAGGKVWTLYRAGRLYALNSGNGQIMFQAPVSGFTHFSTPSAGAGRVFVAANGGIVSYVLNGVPGPPTGVVARAGNTSASVVWTPPVSSGGSPITSYTVTSVPGGVTTTVGPAVNRAVVNGLANATPYRFVVSASNALGTGDNSAPSNIVVPGTGSASIAGYWLDASDGGIFNYGAAGFFGSTGSISLNQPVVGMAATPTGRGYWLVASDGGVFNYGDAGFFGSAGGHPLNKPVVGMAATPTGLGYWLVASDGGVFNYGDAGFFGSTGSIRLNKPVVGMAATPTGQGYWLVASDGGIFNYGDAGFLGSTGSISLNKPVVGMAATPTGQGYWLVASDGGIFNYGDAGFFGSAGGHPLNRPVAGMAS